MRRSGWLFYLGGMATGALCGRWLFRRHPAAPERFVALVPGEQTGRKLTREAVLTMIEQNGGPEGLDLSGYDLSGVNLSKMDLHGVVFGNVKIAMYAAPADITGGANLEGAWLERANLRRANFGRANLKGARLYHSDLTEATLWAANAEGADLRDADLSRANLYSTVLKDASLKGSCLEDANLHLANLAGATLTAASVGPRILQESLEDYRQHYAQWYVASWVRERYQQRHLEARHREAMEIYLALKNAFLDAGRYDDASWAYLKERQMERKTMAPWRALRYHGDRHPLGLQHLSSYSQLPRWHPMVWWFWLKCFFRWLLDWATELSCGYGERPTRTVGVAMLVLAVFSAAYRATAGVGWLDPRAGHEVASGKWLDYVLYSAGAFATIGYEGLRPLNDLARLFTAVEAMLGIALVALLMFTLGNRINRS